jgi:hypothetical protein
MAARALIKQSYPGPTPTGPEARMESVGVRVTPLPSASPCLDNARPPRNRHHVMASNLFRTKRQFPRLWNPTTGASWAALARPFASSQAEVGSQQHQVQYVTGPVAIGGNSASS